MAQMVKNLPAMRETRVNPWARKIPWRREWVPTPVFLLGEFHELRSLVGYNPWGHKELDATERLTHTHTHTHTHGEEVVGSTRQLLSETGRCVLRRRARAPSLKPLSGIKLHV